MESERWGVRAPMAAVVHEYQNEHRTTSGLWIRGQSQIPLCYGVLVAKGEALSRLTPDLRVGSMVFWDYGVADALFDDLLIMHGSALIAWCDPAEIELPEAS